MGASFQARVKGLQVCGMGMFPFYRDRLFRFAYANCPINCFVCP